MERQAAHQGSCKLVLLRHCQAFDVRSAHDPIAAPRLNFPPPEQEASHWGEERFANHFEILCYRAFISPPASYGEKQLSRDKKRDVRGER